MERRRSNLNSNPMVHIGRGMARRSLGSFGRPGGPRPFSSHPRDVTYNLEVEVASERPLWQRHFSQIAVAFAIGLLAVIVASGGFR
jgi:hypothetical protein